jgi:protein-arginine deiminase
MPIMRTPAAAAAMTVTVAALALVVPQVLAATTVAATTVAASTVADLRADVDRNGVVDVDGTTDEAGEDASTATRGAIFLPNLDDDARRCPLTSAAGKALTDAALATCKDGTDTVVNGAADAADLARLRTLPMPAAGSTATATVVVSGTGAAARARLFVRTGSTGNTWTVVKPATKLTTAQVRAGVELGIEANDVVRRNSVWNGRVTVTFTVTDGTKKSADAVVLKVAPLLTQHSLQRAHQVLVTRKNGTSASAKESRRFVEDLRGQVSAAGITSPLFTFSFPADSEQEDVWAQDFFEPATVTMPGAGGKAVGMRVLIRSPQNHLPNGRKAGRQLYERLRGPGVGVLEVPGMTTAEEWTLSSMGNLETIPPYTHGGTAYPSGRIVMGRRTDTGAKPAGTLLALLNAQLAQTPLLLDTSFLHVAHVDEFLHFVPAPTARGWRVVVADPTAGLGILRATAAAGSGAVKLMSAPKKPDLWGNPPNTTVAQALADAAFVADNTYAATTIEANIALLKKETGVTDADIVRVPMLFRQACDDCSDGAAATGRATKRIVPRALAAPEDAPARRLVARLPSAVNGVLLGPDRYLAPRQFGPVVGGVDVFATAVTKAYADAGITVSYVDDWYAYHAGSGNIHCGTNVLRTYSDRWWS